MEERDIGRVVAFTDGVMAVAITLLVLNIEVPDLPRTGEGRLGEELVDLLPSLLAYAVSFALVGRFWIVHHGLFEDLRTFDGTLMVLNLVFLALIALVPFASQLFDTYNEEPVAAAVFGGTLGLAALVNAAMVSHIVRRRLTGAERRWPEPFPGAMALTLAVLFMLSVPAAFLSLTLAHVLWVLALVVRYPLHVLGGRRG